jgi:hypothetical protein
MLTALSSISLDHLPGSLLYFSQAGAYAMAFWTTRCGNHAPCDVYLASCLIHITLGALHASSLG